MRRLVISNVTIGRGFVASCQPRDGDDHLLDAAVEHAIRDRIDIGDFCSSILLTDCSGQSIGTGSVASNAVTGPPWRFDDDAKPPLRRGFFAQSNAAVVVSGGERTGRQRAIRPGQYCESIAWTDIRASVLSTEYVGPN